FLVTEEYWKRQNRLGLNPASDSFLLEEQIVPAPQPVPIPPTVQTAPAAATPPSVLGPAMLPSGNAQTGAMQTTQTNVLGDQNLAERVGRTEAQRMKQEELKNQIRRSAAEINWEYAVVQRLDPDKLTSHLLPFNLGKAIEGDETQNVALQPG